VPVTGAHVHRRCHSNFDYNDDVTIVASDSAAAWLTGYNGTATPTDHCTCEHGTYFIHDALNGRPFQGQLL